MSYGQEVRLPRGLRPGGGSPGNNVDGSPSKKRKKKRKLHSRKSACGQRPP